MPGSVTSPSPHPARAASRRPRVNATRFVSRSARTRCSSATLDTNRHLVSMDALVGERPLARVSEEEHEVHEAIGRHVVFAPELFLIKRLRAVHQTPGKTVSGRRQVQLQPDDPCVLGGRPYFRIEPVIDGDVHGDRRLLTERLVADVVDLFDARVLADVQFPRLPVTRRRSVDSGLENRADLLVLYRLLLPVSRA